MALIRGLRRPPMLMVNAILMVAIAGAAYWRFADAPLVRQVTPADLFMQSIAAEDGALGWNQLCPALQVQLPREVLEQQTEKLRLNHLQTGVTLTIDHMGDWPRD